MSKGVGDKITIRGEQYTILKIEHMGHLGAKFFGKFKFSLRKDADGSRWMASGKGLSHNSRVIPDPRA